MSAANSGYLYQKLNIFERFTFGVAGIVLVFTPYRIVRVGGALLAILVLLLFKKRAVKKTNFGVWL